MGKKKNGQITGTMPGFSTGFDPAATYGRTKKEPFLTTAAGHHKIDQDPEGYLGLFAKANGVNVDSATASPFAAWFKNNYMGQVKGDYDRAKAINPELSFAHYAQSRGIPGDPTKLGGGNTATPVNTGNVYTSSSGVAPVPVPSQKGKHAPKFNNYAQGVVQQNSGALEMARARHEWAKLTPEQQGVAPQGYAYGPAGWSVY